MHVVTALTTVRSESLVEDFILLYRKTGLLSLSSAALMKGSRSNLFHFNVSTSLLLCAMLQGRFDVKSEVFAELPAGLVFQPPLRSLPRYGLEEGMALPECVIVSGKKRLAIEKNPLVLLTDVLLYNQCDDFQ